MIVMLKKTMFAGLFALAGFPVAGWAHGGGAGPAHSEQRPDGDTNAVRRDEANVRRERIESLQEKIDKLDEKLENPRLSAKKRAQLEKKLKKLLDKKTNLLKEAL